MTFTQFQTLLIKNGYEYLENIKPEEFKIFYQNLNDRILVISGINLNADKNLMSQHFLEIQNKVRTIFNEDKEVQLFTVIFSSNIDKAYNFMSGSNDCWIYDTIHDRTIIFDNQPANFYGLLQVLETEINDDFNDKFNYKERKKARRSKKIPLVTLGLVILNIAVFIILEVLGNTEDAEFMARHGALYTPLISNGQDYYRFLSSMFMHFGIEHLLNNMIMLFCIGEILEKQIGKFFYGIIYLISGIGANLVSFWYYLKVDKYVVSAGASGAVFGIIGALLIAVILNRGRLESVTTTRLLVMIGLSLYLGFTEVTTNNTAHIGGLVFGILLGIILIPISRYNQKKN